MKLSDLFEVRNGVASTNLTVMSQPAPGTVPYLRPSSTQQRTIAGWVYCSEIGKKNIYPEDTLFVSTNGEGSHTYSYVSRFKFACNSDVSVLVPKRDMSTEEKIFYAHCITLNRHRFSYGRKPKGGRLKQVELPDTVPDWVHTTNTDDLWKSLERIKELSSPARAPAKKTTRANVKSGVRPV